MDSIKIFIMYHKPSFLIKNEIVEPLHLGRAVTKKINKDGLLNNKEISWLNENMIGDDTGDNISIKNREYCELTGIYWVYKNYKVIGDPDYIGFMHYRRQFIFDEETFKEVCQEEKFKIAYDTELVALDEINDLSEDVIKRLFNPSLIRKCIDDNDILPSHLTQIYSTRERMQSSSCYLQKGDIEVIEDLVKKFYPEYYPFLLKTLNSKSQYINNMFIVKRELFFDYASFVFDILFKAENLIDTSQRSINGKRALAYIPEILFACCFEKGQADGFKMKKLRVMYERSFTKNTFSNKKYEISDIPEFVLATMQKIKDLKSYNDVHIYAAGELCGKYLWEAERQGIEVRDLFDHIAPIERYGKQVKKFDVSNLKNGDVIIIASEQFYEEIKNMLLEKISNIVDVTIL